MDVRELAAADADAAVALWDAAGLTRPWNDPYADFRRAADGPTSAVLGGFAGGALVAAAMVGDDGHRGWVYYVAVDPASRGAGLGGEIMAAAERWLAARGCRKVQLMVRETNAAANGFYERIGYERTDVKVFGRWLDA